MNWCAIYGFLKDWQTLLGAVLALCAAIGTIKMMSKTAKADAKRHNEQIDEIRRQANLEETRHRELLERKRLAARAHMPDALSTICEYVRLVIRHLTGQNSGPLKEPTAALTSLKQAIEHIDTDAAIRTFELVSWYQVQKARRENLRNQPRNPELSDHLYDSVLFYAYANSLFEYARNQGNSASITKPTRQEMNNAFANAVDFEFRVNNEELLEPLAAHIERRHDDEGEIDQN